MAVKIHAGGLVALTANSSAVWRQIDREEWCYILGITEDKLYDAFVEGVKYSTKLRTASIDGDPLQTVACWGVGPSGKPGVGNVWLIATDLAETHGKALHREALRGNYIEDMSQDWVHLEAYVYPRNELHVKWLTLLGFFKTDAKVPFNIPSDVEVWRRNT